MYFDITCFQLVFDFRCFDFCSERFQGKRFQGMRVLRKSSFGGFIFVILFIYFSMFTSCTSSYVIVLVKSGSTQTSSKPLLFDKVL